MCPPRLLKKKKREKMKKKKKRNASIIVIKHRAAAVSYARSKTNGKGNLLLIGPAALIINCILVTLTLSSIIANTRREWVKRSEREREKRRNLRKVTFQLQIYIYKIISKYCKI